MNSGRHPTLGMWLGVLGVAIFALTLPMTRLATGTFDAPQLSPWFVTSGRAALAGALSLVFLLLTRSSLPKPEHGVDSSAWLGLLYVGVFSMWAGFFAWYRGMALGGALRVSQTQLLQPFLSILAAVPLLGEPLELVTLGFALAVMATVFLGKRFSSPPTPVALFVSKEPV